MPTTCDRHPTQSAWWQCPRCRKYSCPQCISRRTGGHLQEQVYYFCPTCNVEVAHLELSRVISPFWARLHKFMVYPLTSVQSVGLILVLSLLSVIFSQPGLFSLLFRFVLWAIMVKYAFEALKCTAEGRFSPPPLSGEVLSENYGIVFKQIALYFALIFIFLFVVVKAGPLVMLLSGIACALALPCMLIILIINDDLGQALNPVMAIGIIFRIGWSYLLLLLFLLLLSGAPAALGYAIIQHMPEQLQLFMFTTAKNYYTLITYHMMGYIILQFHDRLDYPVELETILASIYPAGFPASQLSDQTAEKPQYDELLNEISLLVQEGDFEEAIRRIEDQVPMEDIDDLELSERYIGLLKICKEQDKLLAHAPHHLKLLALAGSKSKAIELYMECMRLDKSFTLQPVILYKIAGWLDESNRHREAILALNALIKKHPKDTMVPKAYYRAAQIFNERMKNLEQAKKILKGLLHKFPDHEISSFAKAYLSRL